MKNLTNLQPEIQEDISKDDERDRIILKHLKQVEILARRIGSKIPASVEHADLVSAGILGLIDAAEKYDPTHEVKFATFAEYRIRGAMLDSLRDLDWAPRSLRLKTRKLQAVCGSLEQSLGRTASEEEKCKALSLDPTEYHTLSGCMARMSMNSLDTPMNTEENRNLTLSKDIAASANDLPSALYEKCEASNIISDAIASLPKRERLVVSLYYFEQITMARIGKILGINESRVSQVHSCAMRRLKTKLRALNEAA
jgi:RNA polymerase sigma factor FliA